MKNKKYLLASILITILFGIVVDFDSSAEKNEKEILIINSHTENYAWTSDVLKGIFETVNSSHLETNIHMESFDYKYYKKSNLDKEVYKLIEENYLDKDIELLITTDLEATEFAINHQDELFKGIPIVFSGLSRHKVEQIVEGVDNITGVIEIPNIEETLRTAFKITPSAKNVYVIHDDTDRGKRYFDEIKGLALKRDNKLKVKTLGNERNLPKDSIIIGTIYLEDETGKTVAMSEVVRKLSKEIDMPIFYLQESTIGHGALGGNVLSPELHGINAGKLALRILDGEEASSIGYTVQIKLRLKI